MRGWVLFAEVVEFTAAVFMDAMELLVGGIFASFVVPDESFTLEKHILIPPREGVFFKVVGATFKVNGGAGACGCFPAEGVDGVASGLRKATFSGGPAVAASLFEYCCFVPESFA